MIRRVYHANWPLERLAKTFFYYSTEAIVSSRDILFNVAFIARQCGPELNIYFQKKIAAGKYYFNARMKGMSFFGKEESEIRFSRTRRRWRDAGGLLTC